MIDSQKQNGQTVQNYSVAGAASVYAGGLISKGQLFFLLRRDCTRYSTRTIQSFFTPERLQRCGLSETEFRRTRLFSADATSVIVSELKSLNLI